MLLFMRSVRSVRSVRSLSRRVRRESFIFFDDMKRIHSLVDVVSDDEILMPPLKEPRTTSTPLPAFSDTKNESYKVAPIVPPPSTRPTLPEAPSNPNPLSNGASEVIIEDLTPTKYKEINSVLKSLHAERVMKRWRRAPLKNAAMNDPIVKKD